MQFSLFTKEITRIATKAADKVAKHAPEILLATGIVSGIGATVMACNATLKAQDILAEAKSDVDLVHQAKEVGGDKYTDKESAKDLSVIYTRTGVKLLRMYWPALALGAVSIASLIASNRIMARRCGAIVAAYAALDQSFRDYRKRVAGTVGESQENDIYHNIAAKNVVDEASEDGELAVVPRVDSSIYGEWFTKETSKAFKDNLEYNLTFLRGQENYLKCRLESEGYLILNDARRELGMKPTTIGAITGWTYDPNRTDDGDNAVSLGIRVEPGYTDGPNVYIEFNVDGVIIDKLDHIK